MYTYKTKGTCSTQIHIEIENNIITHCAFERGCTGNTQGLSKLAVGRSVNDIISLLSGVECQNGTSCPDQLARALIEWKKQEGGYLENE